MSIIKKSVPNFIKRKIKNMISTNMDEATLGRIIEDVSNRKAAAIANGKGGRLNGKTAVVTGATGFIGGCICKRLFLEGATVYACGRSIEKLELFSKNCKQENIDVSVCVMDVTDTESIEKAISGIEKIDIFVNCAGGSARDNWNEIKDQHPAVIKNIIDSNLTGTVYCCKYVSQHMAERKSGTIINISSTIGVGGKAGFSEYAAAKAGIIGFTRSLALELGKYNVNVNCVTPGIVERKLTEEKLKPIMMKNTMNSVGIDNDIAYTVSFLASDEAKFITGQNIIVDGGRSLGLKGD